MKLTKLISLAAACLTALSTSVTAQSPDVLLGDSKSASIVYDDKSGPALSIQPAQPAEEFALSSNEPFFLGGKSALEKHLKSLRLYPHQARLILAEGTVRVRFRVQASGDLTDIEVVQSHGAVLDGAAVKAVALMPRWYPAHRSGMAVSSLVELPITFRLD
ncbi:energy transducer TonB [Spirosoma arcticum]